MAAKLTKKQYEILEFIDNFINQAGYSPTYREIMRGLGYRSVATVAKHIENLVVLGQLEKTGNEARSVSIRKDQAEPSESEIIARDFLKFQLSKFESEGDVESAKKIRQVLDLF